MTPSTADHEAGERDAPAGAPRVREELERFFALSLDILCVADFSGHFTRVNPAVKRLLGHTREELLREPLMSFVHPDDRKATEAEYAAVIGGSEALAFENRFAAVTAATAGFSGPAPRTATSG